MELHIKDRIYFHQILPKENTFMDFAIKKSLLERIALSDEDREAFNVQQDEANGRITWDAEKDQETPLIINFTESELAYIKKGCEALASSAYPDDFWMFVDKLYAEINKAQ